MATTPRILLTHTPEARRLYYGARALSGLQALGEVVLHEGSEPLDIPGLIKGAQFCQIIVADRATPCPAELFAALPELVSVSRVAIDIRNIDVAAASAQGVLVTKASRSWVAAVSELAIGLMIDVARGVSRVDAAQLRPARRRSRHGPAIGGIDGRHYRLWLPRPASGRAGPGVRHEGAGQRPLCQGRAGRHRAGRDGRSAAALGFRAAAGGRQRRDGEPDRARSSWR